ncbi:MAG: efflux RND transporter permease subunit [Pseudomonadota bacterium]
MIALIFNRRLLALSVLFVLAIGAGAMLTTPRAEDPTIQSRNAAVTTLYPGASAQRVEALVTRIIEEELRTLAEINEISSTSRADVSIVSITLLDEVTDVAPVWSRVRDKLADIKADMPSGSLPPDLNDEGGYAYTAAFAVHAGDGRSTDRLILQRYAEELADQLRSIPGTDLVQVHASDPELIEVTVNDSALRAAGLDIQAVAAALSAADARNAAGSVVNDANSLTIELGNTLDNLERLRAIPLQSDGASSMVLGDIAEFRRTVSDPPSELGLFNGEMAVFIGTRMQPGQRVDLWVPQAQAVVEQFSERNVAGVTVTEVFEQASYTTERLKTVLVSLGQGLAIVVIVLLFTMGLRSALSVGLAIPTTALMTAGLFPMVGIDFNQMSIVGVIVALGLMVDNAIIITNDIRERLSGGARFQPAIHAALKKLFFPLAASTFTTMLAFMPIVLLPGGAGEFVGPMSIAVICALGSSFVVSMYIVPALAPILFREGENAGKGWTAQGISVGPLARAFRGFIRFVIGRPVIGIAICLAPVIVGITSLPTVPTSFFPPADRDQFRIEIRLPQSTVITRTTEVVGEIEQIIRQTEGVTQTLTVTGAATPQLYYNVISSESANPAFGNIIINTTGAATTAELIPYFQDTLSEQFPEVALVVRRYEFGPPVSTPVEMRIYGPELEVLAEYGQRAAGILGSVEGAVYARASLHRDNVKLEVDVDDEAARAVGLDAGSIARQINASFNGQTGGFVLEGPEQLPISVRLGEGDRESVDDLAGVTLLAPSGAEVPLTSVADVRPVPAWTDITRLNGARIQSVSSFVEFGMLPSVVQTRFEAALEEADFTLPAGYSFSFEGAQGQRSEAVGRLLSQVSVLLIAAVTSLVVTFNSFRRMGMVFLAGCLARGMGMLVLKLTGNNFGFIVIIGIMGLIGVGINGTIVMTEVLDEDPDARSGDPDAMADIVTGYTARHIWSTTLTTAGGFVPLILLGGDFWPPFAEVFAGGLLLLTLVTFIFTPCAYKLLIARWNTRPDEESNTNNALTGATPAE